MKSQTKSQSISINTIIIAAIALIVLVVLIAIFTGRMGIFGVGLTNAQQGTKCEGTAGDNTFQIMQGSCEEGYTQFIGVTKQCTTDSEKDNPVSSGCVKPGYICCVKKK